MRKMLLAGTLVWTVFASGPVFGQTSVGVRGTWSEPAHASGAFRNMEELFPSRRISIGERVMPLREPSRPFSFSYLHQGRTNDLNDLAVNTHGTGLLILRENRILYERYDQSATPDSRLLSFSMGKSFVSSLIGIALQDGAIRSLDDRIDNYLPEVKGGAYAGASIRDVLEMSSGTAFQEVYADKKSGIARFIALLNRNQGGLYDYARNFKRARKAGVKFNYASADSEVLGALLAKATGKRLADYMSERLWKPMGAEGEARWLLDQPGDAGRELAAGGLLIRLRDYARFGYLAAHDGMVDGRQVLPKGWIAQATRPQRPQVDHGKLGIGTLGYGYQWWSIPGPDRAFMAEGIHGQYLMVNPELHLVVVKTSSWPVPWNEQLSGETFAFFEALTEKIRNLQPTD